MKSDILVVGGGASGLMAAYAAARALTDQGRSEQVTVLEKMPRPGRKIMITGKGRCNFTNVKEWNAFSQHVQAGSAFVKSSFYNLTPERLMAFFEQGGMHTVVERGDRAFPASHRASEVVDTLVNACLSLGVKIQTDTRVTSVSAREQGGFELQVEGPDGTQRWLCRALILATGGLSYPGTGSTGDGYAWAQALGHSVRPLFPTLTALVPRGYKAEGSIVSTDGPRHIDRSSPLSETGQSLLGIQLKNVSVTLKVDGNVAGEEFGDLDFTDGGIEGPVGFQLSRKAVKSLVNGARVQLVLDLKPGVALNEITERVKALWKEVDGDPRSRRLHEKGKCKILLEKLMPRELVPGFLACHPGVMTLERRGRTDTKVWVNLPTIAKTLKEWTFDIAGHVGYERCVVTAGGVATDEVSQKTMESKKSPGLYLCGELLDIDSDTGGYNLHTAFCTGFLAGHSAAR
ncbi:MAG: aminoacetone oxidase family FAD-binding enzyme [Bacteroidales bacterium]|nr:aminoacetone oxidase family FAD-binding enzyme [Bacteroidales bacterium]